jgi:hypothetical protein
VGINFKKTTIKLTKALLNGVFAVLFLLAFMNCKTETKHKPSAIALEKADKQLLKT